MIRNLIVFITLVLIAILPFVTSVHRENLSSGVRIIRNISYSNNPLDPEQNLDLYIPRTKSNKMLPVIVWIHGGGWIEGDKLDSPALELAQKGFASCSINYRLAPKNIFPAQLHDCKAAIRWLRAHGQEYGIDDRAIGVWGVSAGGHLALMLATTMGMKDMEGNLGNNQVSSDIQACCDWCGPADLVNFKDQCSPEAIFSKFSPPDLVDALLGGPVDERKELAIQASPITYVTNAQTKCPPILIMHADNDPIVPFIQSQDLANLLTSKKLPVTMIKVNSDKHVFLNADTFKTVTEFFANHLRPRNNQPDSSSSRANSALLTPL